MSAKLELLSGPAIQKALDESDAQIFRYELNPAGLYLTLGAAGVFFAAGVFCWWYTGLGGAWTVVFLCTMLVGVAFSALAAYWHQYANESLVGISADHLYVGGPKATWVIAWELLDTKSIGFEDLEMTRLRGAMHINVGGQHIKLHMFNAITYLTEIEAFMGGVLTHLPLEHDEAAQLEEE